MDIDEKLVLAMPRRELFRAAGWSSRIDLQVLASLCDESWFAAPSGLKDNLDAKEVRIGVVIVRSDERAPQVLVDHGGHLAHITTVPAASVKLGDGLLMLRQVAMLAGCALLDIERAPTELAGHLNDDALPECRGFILMVYRLRVPHGTAAPEGYAWVSRDRLGGMPLHPISALIVDAVPQR